MTATSALAEWGGFSGRFERDAEWLALRDDIYGAEMLVAATRAFDILPLIKMPTTVSAICTVLNLSERPAEVMLTCLAAMQVIDRSGDTVTLADSSGDVLRNHSRWFQDSFNQRPVYRSILESMRSNAPSGWAANERPWLQSMEDPSFAGKFIATMDARGRYLAPALASRIGLKSHENLLDIAGGSGVYSCCIAALHTHIRAVVLERTPVDSIARETVDAFGCATRVKVCAGDMHTAPLPGGFDVHLWSNVLHDWSASAVRKLLKESFDSLPTGGLF